MNATSGFIFLDIHRVPWNVRGRHFSLPLSQIPRVHELLVLPSWAIFRLVNALQVRWGAHAQLPAVALYEQPGDFRNAPRVNFYISLKILWNVLTTFILVAFENSHAVSKKFIFCWPKQILISFQQSSLKQSNSFLKVDLLPAWKFVKCFFFHLENLLEVGPRRNVFHYPNISKTGSEQHYPIKIYLFYLFI